MMGQNHQILTSLTTILCETSSCLS